MKEKIIKIVLDRAVFIMSILLFIFISGCNKQTVPAKSIKEDTALTGKDFQNYNYIFSEALKQKILKNFPKAIIYYEECLTINPGSDAAMYELSNLYSIVGKFEESLMYGKKAVKADPENIWYLLNLANLYQALNKSDSSLLVYKKIHSRYPGRTDIYMQLGNLYADNRDYKKALKIYDEIEEKYGKKNEISLIRIEIYERTNKTEKAEKEILYLTKNYPDEIKYLIMAAEFYYGNGDFEKADDYYKLAEINNPADPAIKLSMLGFYRKKNEYKNFFNVLDSLISGNEVGIDKKLQILNSLITDGREIDANKSKIENVIKVLQNNSPDEIRIYILKGDFYSNLNEYKEALLEYKNYLRNERGNYYVWQQVLYLENMSESYHDLYDDSKIATELFQQSPVFYFFYGVSCIQLKKNEKAIKVFKLGMPYVGENRALKLQYYSLLGEAYKNIREYDLSDKSFENALKIDKNNLIVLNNYAYYLSLRNDMLDKALKMSRKTIEAEKENSTYLDTYGWIFYKMENYIEAEKYLKKAIEFNKEPSAEILEHYGDVLLKVQKRGEAIVYWKKAMNAGGNKELLSKKIKNSE